MSLGEALGTAAPIYNLIMVCIVVFLFVKLFRTPRVSKMVFLTPWKFVFAAVVIFIIEELLTVFRNLGGFSVIPRQLNGFFELVIILCFLYAIFSQRQHVEENYS